MRDRLDGFLKSLQSDLLRNNIEPSARSEAYARLGLRFKKRAQIGDTRTLKRITEGSFMAINNLVKEVTISLSPLEVATMKNFIEDLTWRYTSAMYGTFQSSITDDIFSESWRFGPGASIGTRSTHACDKLGECWTVTRRALPYVLAVRRSNVYLHAFDLHSNMHLALTDGSRIGCVPKNEDTMRTIAVEPTGNMVCQLAVGRHIERCLANIGLDIRTQELKNKRLAYKGSIDGSLSTIDLKSASDMISLPLAQAVLPTDLFETLIDLRSERALIGGRTIDLHMLSTMGNGFTFPVMTLILLAAVYANRFLNHNGPRNFIDWSKTAVYGDDIIVPTSEFESLCDLLSRAGLIINRDKSYCDGPFRESCGGDYYKGVDITPFYVETLLSDSDYYVITNKLIDWCVRHNFWLNNAMLWLRNNRPKDLCLVPEWMNPDSGVRTSSCPRRFSYIRPKVRCKSLRDNYFAMMLVCGGYLNPSSGKRLLYTVRDKRPRYEKRKGLIPYGYENGWDPLCGSVPTSLDRSTYVDFIASALTSFPVS